ncbi:MAG TPA: IS1634 family transposase [Geminicoccaceae bacterium]|nr:IS1634 family transposase [Geminicoccaceae bacterium]
MYIDIVPNRGSPPAVLLRESYREGGRIRKRTLANLSKLPLGQLELLRAVLRGERLVPAGEGPEIERALPDGHVQAVLGTLRRLGLDRLLPRGPERRRNLALGLIVARLLEPAAKLATARALDAQTAGHSLGLRLALGQVRAKEVYAALDWLGAAQPAIEAGLARRHLGEGTLVLYDVTSSYLEGRCCELARFGYSRDGRRDRPQIVIGLLCAAAGCPVAVEVFAGDVADPVTLETQIAKLKQRFRLRRVVLVGDRGLVTRARIEAELKPAGLDWITSLRAPAIRRLVEDGPLQLSLFDERDLAEIDSPDYPGERLIVCRNPALAAERSRKRDALLDLTERDLQAIQARVRRARQPLRGAAAIGQAVGAVRARRKVGKHFQITIADDDLRFARDQAAIAAEAALDGLYVLRTSLPADAMAAADTVRAYKSLARAEQAFRSLKTVDLEVRPIFHWTAPRVRAHVLLCMLAYHLEWHMRQALAPLLFDDHDRAAGEALRASPVAKATPSPAARRKAATKRTDDGLPVHSFRSLLADLATLTRNTVRFGRGLTTELLARPTQVHSRAFELLALKPAL